LKKEFLRDALLVIDCQKYFTKQNSHAFVPSAETVIKNINSLIGCFRPANVFYTKHIKLPDSNMVRWWGKALLEGEFVELDERIKIVGKIFSKHTYSAFFGTDLHRALQQGNIERLFISGFLTNLCCETTAREAFLHGYQVLFLADATATYSEELHVATLLNLAHGFAKIITVEEILSWEENDERI